MLEPPLVSVLIPTRNRGALLERAILSAAEEGYQSIEIVVVDDGSTDDTSQRVLALREQLASKIVYVPRSHAGAPAARNAAAAAATGEFLLFLDSDDHLLPGKICESVARLAADPALAMICTEWFVDNNRNERSLRRPDRPALDALLKGQPIRIHANLQTTSPLWRAAFWRSRNGHWPEDLSCWHENSTYLPLLLAASADGWRIEYLDRPLYVQDYSNHERIGSGIRSDAYLVSQATALERLYRRYSERAKPSLELIASYRSHIGSVLRRCLEQSARDAWRPSLTSASRTIGDWRLRAVRWVPFAVLAAVYRISQRLGAGASKA